MADDPRLGGTPRGINDELLDDIIRRAIRVEQFKKGEARWVADWIRTELHPELIELVTARLAGIEERGYDLGALGPESLRDLEGDVRDLIRARIGSDLATAARERAERWAEVESAWMRRTIQGRLGDGIYNVVAPTQGTLRSIVRSRPFQGRVMRQWYTDLSESAQKGVRDAIRQGMAQSETIDQIVRRIRGTYNGRSRVINGKRFRDFDGGVLPTTTRQAQAIATTATNHVSNHAREALYDANPDLVKGIRWVSTLDSRTTPQCQSLDGKHFKAGEGPRPPIHWRCRSSTAPWLVSWRELDIDADDLTPEFRASMNGKVAGDVTYEGWLKTQPAAFQKEVLGKARYELFREGASLGSFVSKSLRPLTLEQIAAQG